MLQKLLAQLGWWMVILNFSKTRLQQTLWDEPNVFVITGVTNVVNMDMGLKSWKKLFSLTRLLLLSLTVLPILLIYFFSLKRVYYFPQNEFTIFLKMCLLYFSFWTAFPSPPSWSCPGSCFGPGTGWATSAGSGLPSCRSSLSSGQTLTMDGEGSPPEVSWNEWSIVIKILTIQKLPKFWFYFSRYRFV